MNLRRIAFFLQDSLHGSNVKKQLREIRKANSNDKYFETYQRNAEYALLEHIKNTVPFYEDKDCSSLEKLPVVNKVMMKKDPSQFLTTADIKLGKKRFTSGSTGIPFEIHQDSKKAKRIQAELVYYREETGDKLGTPFVNLISPSRMEKSSRLSEIKQNVINIDVTKMTDEVLEQLYQKLKANSSIFYMMGYVSALERIADYFLRKGYTHRLGAVVSSSEILTESIIEKLKKVFDCPVYDRYSNEDNGFIAQTDGRSHDFIVNRASYKIEIMKMDCDEAAEENEIGRIVITDLFNYSQSFVRYDTGDLGAYSYKDVNGCNRLVLTTLAGRISDVVYDTSDRPVSTFAIGCALETFEKIYQYQLIQNNKFNYKLVLNNPGHDYEDAAYQKSLCDLLGQEINVDISYVDSIPTLNSGKFKRVICNYHPESK